MFTTNTESIITSLVSQLLDKPGARSPEYLGFGGALLYNTGVLIELALVVRDDSLDFEAREDGKVTRHYYMAFCGNTSVFVAQRDVPHPAGSSFLRHFSEIPPEDWENTSNHDSCWRSDGFSWLSEAYFEMCGDCNSRVPPIKLSTECTLGFMSLWKDVKMETQSADLVDSYRRKLVKIEAK